MTREEAKKEIEKVFEPAFANYIVEALTKGATVSEQETTTKDNLGVDCVSRQEVDRLAYRYLKEPTDNHVAFYEDFLDLPSVTPIRPKGHWIEQIDHEENCRTLICSNCDKPALHDGDSIWKHKFCPNCGADMREVEE